LRLATLDDLPFERHYFELPPQGPSVLSAGIHDAGLAILSWLPMFIGELACHGGAIIGVALANLANALGHGSRTREPGDAGWLKVEVDDRVGIGGWFSPRGDGSKKIPPRNRRTLDFMSSREGMVSQQSNR
jgi:hypothetical protein